MVQSFHRWLALALIVFAPASLAGVDTGTDENDVMLAGHDPVAYFTEGKPVKGKPEFTAAHGDAIYRFASAEHRDLFKTNPDKYVPAYGGHCAYGMTFGAKFLVDGQSFYIMHDRLFVNKNVQVGEEWEKDIVTHVSEAETLWPKAKDVPADVLLAEIQKKREAAAKQNDDAEKSAASPSGSQKKQ